MQKIKALIFIVFVALSCTNSPDRFVIERPKVNANIDDDSYVVDSGYQKGDSRRYGVFPNKPINNKNFKNLVELASKGLPIDFSKGFYNISFELSQVKNATFVFNQSTISGYIIITNTCSNIAFKGNLTILDKLFIKESSNISFDTLTVKSDTLKSIFKKKNRGVSIYAGSKFIGFNKLSIKNTGGTQESFYRLSAAALQIHGYNNNPEYIKVKDLVISNSDRTALFLTGNYHKFDKVSITNFGLGSAKNMFGLEDAIPSTEKEFSGAWLSKCNNVVIDSLEINQNLNKGVNSIRLDEGKYHEPTFINHIKITGFAKELNIADHKLTNILVKDEYE